MREDFPDPDTPVTHVNKPIGILTSILFKLFACALEIEIHLLFGFIRFVGIFIFVFQI